MFGATVTKKRDARANPRAQFAARRKRRARKNYLLSPAKAATYAVEFAALLLLASVEEFGGALALGLFAGLTYARQNLLVVAPMYALSVVAFAPDPWTVLFVAVPILVFAGIYVVFFRLRRSVHPLAVTAAAVVSELPHAVLSAFFGHSVTASVLCAVLTGVVAFCAQTVCYAVLLRGIKTRFTPDEMIAGGLLAVVFCFAAGGAEVEGFNFLFALHALFLMIVLRAGTPAAVLSFSALAGVGGMFAFASPDFLAYSVLAAAAAYWVAPFGRWASAAATVAVYAVMWQVFAIDASDWQNIIGVALGAGAFAVIPASLLSGLPSPRAKSGVTGSLVNRVRGEMSERLYSASRVFYDMSENLSDADNATRAYTPERLAKEVAKNYCGRCSEREACFAALGGDTSSVILPMASAALSRGKTTILDMPPFVTSRCVKMHNLASVVNSAGQAYGKRMEEAGEFAKTKRVMSEQFAGVSLVLDSLARELGERVSFSEEGGDELANELLRHNIVAREVVMSGEGADATVALTVRASDADKLVLSRVVSRFTGTELEKVSVSGRGEDCVVHLAARSVYEVAYGSAEKLRQGEGVSGDTKSVLCPSRKRRLFALSDGMGSGERAADASKKAISMVENFYRAGFDNAVILSLVNRLLCMSGEESFSSIDISVIDTVTGGLDIIKMGAASTFIRRRDGIEVIACEAPPAGILERAKPLTGRHQLYDGDMVVMMSDGVFDALDEQGVAEVTEEADTSNPQVLADRLLQAALSRGAEDDCTVLVMRLFAL